MDQPTKDFLKSVAAGIIRHAATTAAGALVTYGLIDNSESTQAVGAIAFFLGVGWSYAEKHIRFFSNGG